MDQNLVTRLLIDNLKNYSFKLYIFAYIINHIINSNSIKYLNIYFKNSLIVFILIISSPPFYSRIFGFVACCLKSVAPGIFVCEMLPSPQVCLQVFKVQIYLECLILPQGPLFYWRRTFPGCR